MTSPCILWKKMIFVEENPTKIQKPPKEGKMCEHYLRRQKRTCANIGYPYCWLHKQAVKPVKQPMKQRDSEATSPFGAREKALSSSNKQNRNLYRTIPHKQGVCCICSTVNHEQLSDCRMCLGYLHDRRHWYVMCTKGYLKK